ncbi:MAG: FAD-dependent oxidoreductase [Oscillospiraceae bacterium]|nr:FAD-dependent oxidoreductase [Oscillospiraceae bacterium]
MKVVIIGGVAGGATAAARIRRLDESAEIIIFERSGYISYANCGLPYYVGGVIEDRGELTLQTPESFRERFRIDVKVRHEVTAIDTEKKTVTVRALDAGSEFAESYDRLLIATGARPVVPNMPGVELENVFSLRTVEDAVKIRGYIEKNAPRSAVIAGGGYIGVEMAENLIEAGLSVTIVQQMDQLLAPFDADMASLIHAELKRHGAVLKFGSTVAGFEKSGDGVKTFVEGEAPMVSDIVILAIGVAPDTALAKKAGLELGIRGSIAVNEKMETSAPDVYAVGDAVQVKSAVTGENTLISLAGPANKQGRIAADNICGGQSRFKGSMGSSVIKLFDMTLATTGINEKTAAELGIDTEKVVLSPASHASYYPGAESMVMKVICDKKTQRLLGAQIVGGSGVDKRIDVLAAAIHAGMTGPELKELDLAYAPPYSSAKDPVNMAGFMFENVFGGLLKQFHYDEVSELPRDGSVTLLDTRTRGEYARGHIDGFVNIPVDELRERIGEIPERKTVYVMCQSGLRSYIACRLLEQRGFDCRNLSGGYGFYSAVMKDRKAAREAYPCGMEKSE